MTKSKGYSYPLKDMPLELAEKLKASAKASRRSINQQIIYLVGCGLASEPDFVETTTASSGAAEVTLSRPRPQPGTVRRQPFSKEQQASGKRVAS